MARREPFDVPSVLQEALDSSSSDEKQQSANQIVAMSKEHLMRQHCKPTVRSPDPHAENPWKQRGPNLPHQPEFLFHLLLNYPLHYVILRVRQMKPCECMVSTSPLRGACVCTHLETG